MKIVRAGQLNPTSHAWYGFPASQACNGQKKDGNMEDGRRGDPDKKEDGGEIRTNERWPGTEGKATRERLTKSKDGTPETDEDPEYSQCYTTRGLQTRGNQPRVLIQL